MSKNGLKLLSLMLAVFIIAGFMALPVAAAYTQPGDNAFPNYSFEDENVSFTAGASVTNAGRTNEDAKTGSYSFKFTVNGNYSNTNADIDDHYVMFELDDGIEFIKGQTYGVSFWVRAAQAISPDCNFVSKLKYSQNEAGGAGTWFYKNTTAYIGGSNTWQMKGEVFTISTEPQAVTDGTRKIKFFLGACSDPANKTFYIDDIFVTKIEGDTRVASSTPAKNEVVTEPVSSMTLNFSYPIDLRTLSTSSFTVAGATIASVETSNEQKTVTLNFTAPVTSGPVSVGVSSDIKDVFGRNVVADNIAFSVGEAAPVVLSSVPANGATEVPLFSDLLVKFSTPLDPTTVNTTNITTADATITDIDLENEDMDVRVKFAEPLDYNKLINILIKDIESAEGVKLAAPVTISFITSSVPLGEDRPYTRPGNNAVPNPGFEYASTKEGLVASSGATYTFGTWTGGRDNPSQEIIRNYSRAIGVNFVKDYRDNGDYVEIPLKEGFRFEPNKKYGVYFWGYSNEFTHGIGINVKWNNTVEAGGNNKKYKSINCGTKVDWDGWEPKYAIWDFAPGGIHAEGITAEDIVGDPVVRLIYNKQEGSLGTIFCKYDNLYITEIAGEPRIYSVTSEMEGDSAKSILVEFEYPIKPDRFTGANAQVKSGDVNVPLSNVELLEDMQTVKIDFADPIPAGDYTVSFGDDVLDLWDRAFTDNKTANFTVEAEEGRYSVESFKFFNGAAEITDGKIPASATVTAKATNITNNTGENGGVYLILALYKGSRLVAVDSASAQIAADATLPLIEKSLSVPSLDDGNYTLKAFLWEDLVKLIPIQTKKLTE